MTAPAAFEAIAGYSQRFGEQAGYLNFASYGPPSSDVVAVSDALLGRAFAGAPGASEGLHAEDLRARAAFARLSGFGIDGVTIVPNTSTGLFQVAFGLPEGKVLVGRGEFPANLYPWWRSAEAGRAEPAFLDGQVTPEAVRAALTPEVVALSVSAVDFKTGFRADLGGLRDAIGPERLLIVDGIQGFGAIDQDWTAADVLVVGGQKWLRAGWGAGALALSDRALNRLQPLLGGWTGVTDPAVYDGSEHAVRGDALRFSLTNLSPFASGMLAAALELLEAAGPARVAGAIAQRVELLLDALARSAVEVLSPGEPERRAGIVVAGVPHGAAAEAVSHLTAAGITVTRHGDDRIRLSPHATTPAEALLTASSILGGLS